MELLDRLCRESDRGCVIAAAAAIDEGLERLLLKAGQRRARSIVTELLTTRRSIRDVSPKLDLCNQLDLIPPATYRAAAKLVEIRNQFGHQLDRDTLTAEDLATLRKRSPLVAAAVAALPVPARAIFSTPRCEFMAVTLVVEKVIHLAANPRRRAGRTSAHKTAP